MTADVTPQAELERTAAAFFAAIAACEWRAAVELVEDESLARLHAGALADARGWDAASADADGKRVFPLYQFFADVRSAADVAELTGAELLERFFRRSTQYCQARLGQAGSARRVLAVGLQSATCGHVLYAYRVGPSPHDDPPEQVAFLTFMRSEEDGRWRLHLREPWPDMEMPGATPDFFQFYAEDDGEDGSTTDAGAPM